MLAGSLAAVAQGEVPGGQTLVVIPFENHSKAPGIEWVSESFPELLHGRLNSSSLYVLTRTDRLRAYDRLGIPVDLHPSRATIYRIAEQMDVDYVLLGAYNFDGQTFTASARLLDMRRQRLLPELHESGRLPELINIQTGLAWDVLHALYPGLTGTRQAYLASAPAIRLDAFESYVRGMLAPTGAEQIRRLNEAVRLNPAYPEALLELGKACYRGRLYDQAITWLAQIPPDASESREANFYLGLAAFYQGSYERAEAAFSFVASHLPLAEVSNNLGVVASHRGQKAAVDFFQKAVDADPNEADYRFNLGVALYRSGDLAGASRQLHEALAQRPGDAEARAFLDTIASNAIARAQKNSPPRTSVPLERIRSNYEESSFRQVVLKMGAVAELRLAKEDPRVHARFHADRGHELLAQGFLAESEREFREAIALDPLNAEAHSGLARALEGNEDLPGARSEAEAALRLRQFVEPLLVLVRLDLRDNRADTAADHVDKALRLDPSDSQTLALKRAVAAKLAEKAQPLPNR